MEGFSLMQQKRTNKFHRSRSHTEWTVLTATGNAHNHIERVMLYHASRIFRLIKCLKRSRKFDTKRHLRNELMKPTISVMTVKFNALDVLPGLIESTRAQTDSDVGWFAKKANIDIAGNDLQR